MADVPREAPAPPDVASIVFGDRLPLAESYAGWLADAGVERGLIGPREAPRLWDRHLLNCAAVAEVLPTGAEVADIGSGAGLPGVVLAIGRPDLRLTLVEPLSRRVAFLEEVCVDLGLDNVEVVRGRAEELACTEFDVTVSRAVAPLPRLTEWCLPLTRVGGAMVALKGSRAPDEVAALDPAVWGGIGAEPPVIVHCGAGTVDPPTTVVQVVRTRECRVRLSGRDVRSSDRPRRRRRDPSRTRRR